MEAIKEIVDALKSDEIGVLRPEETVLFSLVETYSEATGFTILSQFVRKLKNSRVDVFGRRRQDLLQALQSMQVHIVSQSRIRRETPVVDAQVIQKMFENFLFSGPEGEK